VSSHFLPSPFSIASFLLDITELLSYNLEKRSYKWSSQGAWVLVRRVVLAILLLAAAGCTSRPLIAPTAERRREDLLQGLSRSHDRLRSMRGRGRIAVSTGGKTYSGNFSLIYRKPASLRLDVYGPFGIHFVSISAVDDSVLALVPLAAVAFVTRGSTAGVGGLGDIVTADMLREFATATLSAAGRLDPDRVTLEQGEGDETLVFEDSGLVNRIALNPKTGAMLARYIHEQGGKLLLSCEYSRFKLTGRVLRPYVITVSENGTDNRLEMVYEHQSLNSRVRDRDFDLLIPKGFEVIQDQ
jgi:outer membrane lipoprotein-sorting protein